MPSMSEYKYRIVEHLLYRGTDKPDFVVLNPNHIWYGATAEISDARWHAMVLHIIRECKEYF